MNDVNELIGLARQMGLIDSLVQRKVPNATECLTRADVRKSYTGSDDQTIELKMEHIYGILMLLAIGLGLSLLVGMGEQAYHALIREKKEETTEVIVM